MSDTPITDREYQRIHNATCLPDCDNYGHNKRCPYASPEVQMAEVSRQLEEMCEEFDDALDCAWHGCLAGSKFESLRAKYKAMKEKK